MQGLVADLFPRSFAARHGALFEACSRHEERGPGRNRLSCQSRYCPRAVPTSKRVFSLPMVSSAQAVLFCQAGDFTRT